MEPTMSTPWGNPGKLVKIATAWKVAGTGRPVIGLGSWTRTWSPTYTLNVRATSVSMSTAVGSAASAAMAWSGVIPVKNFGLMVATLGKVTGSMAARARFSVPTNADVVVIAALVWSTPGTASKWAKS